MSQFNFGTSGTGGGGFSFGTPKTAASTAPTGFAFSSSTSGGGFSFGTPAQNPATTQATGLFSFATPATSAQTSGFSFGPPSTSAPASAGNVFTLGGNAAKLNLGGPSTTQSSGITGGFGLGSSGSAAVSLPSSTAAPSGFVFGTTTTSQPATTGGFSFGNAGTAQSGASTFSLGSMGNVALPAASTAGLTFGGVPSAASAAAASAAAATVTTSQPVTAFSLGTQSTGSGFGLLAAPATTSVTTGVLSQGPSLSFGTKLGGTTAASAMPATPAASSLLGPPGPTLFASIASSSAPAASSATSLTLGVTSTGTTPAANLGFGSKVSGTITTAPPTTSSTASVPSTGFLLNLKPLATTGTTASTSTVTTTTVTAPPVMTYAQLESLINKWSLELEDQEKHFLQQATQVNAWDRTLIENGEKITSLHREVEKVKLDQKRLDQELDFILSQQKELEDLLIPLEESVKEQSGTIYLQHADEEREKTYKLAENIDAQLKRMAQDLKDIIEHLNTSAGPADTSDPLQQICKILNAHMDSLQWIDQNSALLQRKVEEVTKVCESRRKEQERSFRITFD
uniref:Nuclear pore glycoprotein p62 n=1 Tax=Salvator merianae TaxID=96440 RepID=A0A8D0DKC6_SALMN